MTQVNEVQKKYCSRAIFLAITIALVLLLTGTKPAARGLILGTLFSILNFILIARSLPLQLEKGRRGTFLVCFGSIGMRYSLMALPIIFAARSERFSLIATAAGLFMVQGVILLHHFGQTFTEFINSKRKQSISFSGTDER